MFSIDPFKEIPNPCSYSTFLADFYRWLGQGEVPHNNPNEGEKCPFEKGWVPD
jgi:hypothetical protein